MNYYKGADVFECGLTTTLLPINNAPTICITGIYSGKLKGLITTQGP